MEPDAIEIRVVGCLIEKQRTTPDVYPLTLNSLRLACNQSTNRDPVVDYDDGTVRAAIDRLVARKWATLASWANRRTMKYRHTLDRALGLDDGELALAWVLMLRGRRPRASCAPAASGCTSSAPRRRCTRRSAADAARAGAAARTSARSARGAV